MQQILDRGAAEALPYSFYRPGQFADIAGTEFGRQLWSLLAAPDSVMAMLIACENGLPPLRPLEKQIQDLFAALLPSGGDSDRFKTLCLNMAKQIMRHYGHEHTACVFQPPGSFFKTAGMFCRN